MFTRLTALTLALSTLSNASFGEGQANLITIRGLNVDSSIQEIEDLLGACEPHPEHTSSFLCGRGDKEVSGYWGGYQVDEAGYGRIRFISIPCEFINGCEYSEKDLADLLSDNLALSEPELKYPGSGMSFLTMYGQAGDDLTVSRYNDNYFGVSIGVNNYRKPTLNLD